MSTPTNSHPLEDLFNTDLETAFKFGEQKSEERTLELGATITDPSSGEIITRTSDADSVQLEKEERIEDLHIDANLEQIRAAAYEAFEAQHRMSQEADPRFSARNAEVSAQFLNLALNAVSTKIDAKFKRQKVRIAKQDAGTPNTVNNNNLIIGDRNAVLEQLMKAATPIIENEPKK